MHNCIASRSFVLDGEKEVIAYIGCPSSSGAFDEFNCDYEVVGLSKRVSGTVTAIDAIQAIILAIARVGSEITDSTEAREKRLTWLGEDLGRNKGIFTFDDLQAMRI